MIKWKAIGPCDSGPCQNGGTCSVVDGEASCVCPAGFTDQYCDTSMKWNILEDLYSISHP